MCQIIFILFFPATTSIYRAHNWNCMLFESKNFKQGRQLQNIIVKYTNVLNLVLKISDNTRSGSINGVGNGDWEIEV